MSTVLYIPEHKQSPSAMRACIRYCVQEKKTMDADGRQSTGSTALALMLTRNLWQRRICTVRHPGSTSTNMSNPSVRGKSGLMKKLIASVWNLPGKPSRDTRFWSPRIWMHMMTAVHSASTTILLSTRSASRTAERFTLPRIRYRSCGRSATTSAATTGCLFCRRRSAEMVRASVRGSTAPP